MTAAWPETLPEFVLSGAQETLAAEVVESAITEGPSQARRRVRSQRRAFSVQVRCSADQLAVFETFYNETLVAGVLPFTWVHPRTREAGRFRFTGPAPQISPRGTGEDGVFAAVSFKLIRIG